MDELKRLIEKQSGMEFDSEKNWQKVHFQIKRQKRKKRIIVLSIITLFILTPSLLLNSNKSELYNDDQFERIVSLENSLESEIAKLSINEEQSDDRLLELIERLSVLNERIEHVKLEIRQNPLNPNYHRVYLAMLKSKRNIIETLNNRG